MSKKKSNVIRIVGIAALLLAAGFGIYNYVSNKKSEKDTNSDSKENEKNEKNDNSDNSNSDNSNSEEKENKENTDNTTSDTVTPPKPDWWQFAHPAKSASAITNDELDILFDNIAIPWTSKGDFGYITANGNNSNYTKPVTDVISIIYIPTGEFVTDIDKDFYKSLLNNATQSRYSMEKVDGKIYNCVKVVK